ncbi:10093_t:CDS:2, partial [Funneliformis mosseae]
KALQSNKASINILFSEIFNLLMYLKDDIIVIQEELDIDFYSFLEDNLDVILEKYINREVKKIWFTEERLPLFLKVTSQQLYEIFVKNLTSTDQYPYLE